MLKVIDIWYIVVCKSGIVLLIYLLIMRNYFRVLVFVEYKWFFEGVIVVEFVGVLY